MQTRLLLVEDEPAISRPLVQALERERFQVTAATTAAEARSTLGRHEFDLVLLDVGLPDADGRDLCREITASSAVPVIIVSARGEEVDRVVGLELGADDYVTKPFSAAELVARIHAVLRRAARRQRPRAVEIDGLVLDPLARSLTRDGVEVTLTSKEFDLLHLLMARAGEVVRREEIMDEVWDPHWFGPTKTLDVHVAGLRRKLGDDAVRQRYIRTVRGVGLRFSTAEELSRAAAG